MVKIRDLVPWTRQERQDETGERGDNPLVSLQHELSEAIERFMDRFGRGLSSLDLPWNQNEAKSDIVQTGKGVEISMELPGLEMDDIDISISGDMLIVKGEKKIERQEEKSGYYLSERSYGQIYRALPLPPGVDPDKAEASLKNGVLTIHFPQSKEAQSRTRKIPVRSA